MMRSSFLSSVFLFLASLLSFSPFGRGGELPQYVFFTYMGDPSTTLTVNWQTLSSEPGEATVHYDTISHKGVASDYAFHSEGVVSQIKGLDDRHLYRTQLTGLKASETYYLCVGSATLGLSQEFKVKTIPSDDSPLCFVTGGDMGGNPTTRRLLRNSATYNPDFAVVGGDIAYANGRVKNVKSWDAWLSCYSEEMLTAEGYSIPLLLAIGNHEVDYAQKEKSERAAFYFDLFGQESGRSHFVRQFGENLVLFILDTGHWVSHESQVDWMREQFSKYQNMKYKAAVYHVPLYPSHRDFITPLSRLGREYWSAPFDDFGLTVAFENHEHAFKRTHLIKTGAVSTNGAGTLYLGDGCWGRETRSTSYGGRWYLDEVASIQHFWVANMNAEKAVYRAVNLENRVFDVYPQTEPDAVAARKVMAEHVPEFTISSESVMVEGYHNVESQWFGGGSTITLHNPLDHPLSVHLVFKSYHGVVRSTGIPDEPILLDAGEKRVLPIVLTPEQGSISRDKAQMRIKVTAEMDHPKYKAPLLFKGAFIVHLRP